MELQTQIDELNARITELQKGVRWWHWFLFVGIVYYGVVRPTWFPQSVITCERLIIVDKDGKQRIAAGTFADGYAGVQWLDKDGNLRISATTFASGQAGVQWLDKDGKMRIGAATLADGTVVLPTKDLKK